MPYPFTKTLCAVAVALLLAACANVSAPPAVPATAAAPGHFKEADTAAAAAMVPDAWWSLFQDPVLDDLEQRLVIGNENLQLISGQLANARALLAAANSASQPSLSAGLTGTRSAGGNSSNGGTSTPGNYVSLTGSASWELDLWGRLSQGVKSAQAGVAASLGDLAAARLSAQATLAQTYFSLRSAEIQQELLQRTQQAYQRALDLTQARYHDGIAAQTDVLQAQTQLATVQAQNADIQAQRAQYEHAIAVLLGQAPSAFSIAVTAQLPAIVQVPQSLPAELLQRRPDIAAAEQRVQAAYANIGIADAAFFPTLDLSASAGYGQTSLANLFSAPMLLWSAGASISQTIFDGGAHSLASAQARASADQATATYRQTVLTSLQEVEDNLVINSRLQEELSAQTRAWEASTHTLELVLEQYRAGTVSYLNVTAAQSTALSNQIALLGTRTRQLTATSVLLKNLGGRWDPSAP